VISLPQIAIYAGHGGRDPGAIGVNGAREKDFTLAVSNATSAILRQWGYQVLNNRTTDVDRNITNDANKANQNRVDALVEIHLNSNEGPPATGTEAFISVNDVNRGGRARALANAILNRIARLGYTNRGVKTLTNAQQQDVFGILRLTNMPAVLLECAFINNPIDMSRFNTQQMAMAIAESVRELYPITGGSTGCLPAYPGTALRLGARGESVRLVQRCLNLVAARQPGISRLSEDGVFGPLTQASIIAFQRIFGLTADGVVGPITWDRISREAQSGISGLPPYPGTALRVGSSGESVRRIQRCLNNVATRHPSIQRLNEDGVFGPLTQASVMAFQRIFGLTADGVVGPITWDRLSRECSGTTSTNTHTSATISARTFTDISEDTSQIDNPLMAVGFGTNDTVLEVEQEEVQEDELLEANQDCENPSETCISHLLILR